MLHAGLKRRKEFPQEDLRIHNDMNLWQLTHPENRYSYQGGLSLCDTPKGAGGFRCIPGFHKLKKIKEYRHKYERGLFHESKLPQRPPIASFVFFHDQNIIRNEVVEVPLNAGDFVIWSSRLPHSNCINESDRWRLQSYIRMVPSPLEFYDRYRKNVAECVESGRKPAYFPTGLTRTGSDNAEWEMELWRREKQPLGWLGERLFGLKEWQSDEPSTQ